MESQKPLLAVQMYTLRDLTQSNMSGTLEEVASIGYRGIELAGYGDLTVDELKAKTSQLGLQVVSAHIALDALQNEFDRVVSDSQTLGNQFVVCPFLSGEWRGSRERYEAVANLLNDIGLRLHEEAGLQLCYHNHDFEFQQFDGRYGLDIIFENSDARYVQAEIDTYWVEKAGVNAAEYVRKYSGRAPLIHLKDLAADGDFAAVGQGTMDWPAIFHASEAGGCIAYIVEQDVCPGNPLDSIRASYEYLRTMGKV